MASRIYDFTLAASVGATQRLDVMASRVKIISSAYAVEVRTDTGDVYSLLAGQGFSLPAGQTFREVVLRNTVALAQAGVIFIGDETFEDSRVTGDVTVIDNSASKTVAGNQFINSQTAVADVANVSVAAIYANGKRVSIKSITVQSTIAGDVVLGTGTSTGTSYAGPGPVRNKSIGAAVSTYQTAAGIQAGATPTAAEVPGYSGLIRVFVAANTPFVLPLKEPIVISGTQQLVLNGQVINRIVGFIHEAEELG